MTEPNAEPLSKTFRSVVILAVTYFVLADLGLRWATISGAASPVFPAAGVALAGLLVGGVRLWPAVFVGRLAAGLFHPESLPLWTEIAIAAGNTLAAVAGAQALRWARLDLSLSRLRDALALVASAIGHSAIGATIGAAALALALSQTVPQAAVTWANWFAGTLAGVLVVTPVVLAWGCGGPVSRVRAWWLHVGMSTAVALLTTWVIFGPQDTPLLRTFLIFPALIWAAVAGGVRGASTAMLLVAGLAVWGTTMGYGPLASSAALLGSEPLRLILLQQFVTVAAVTVLILAVVADERRGAEAVQDSERRLAQALEAGQLGFWDWDIPSGRVQFGGQWAAMLGYAPGEIEPHISSWERLIHPDDAEQVARAVRDHLEGRNALDESEHRLRHKNNSWCWILHRGRVVQRDADGRPLRAVGTHTDVTARRHAEESLRKSEATLNAVLDALPVGVVIADSIGVVVRTNAAHNQLWGLPPETTSWSDYGVGFWPDTGARIKSEEWAMSRALLTGEIVTGELVECEQFGTGERRFYLNHAAPVRDPEGTTIAGVVVEIDVTERLAAERALRDSEQRLRLAGEAAGIGFWTWDLERSIASVDATCGALFGLEPDVPLPVAEVIGVIHPDDRQQVEARAVRAMVSVDRYEVEFRVLRPDGSTRWLAGLGNAVRDGFKSVRLAGVNWDITERKQADAERADLLRSERAARMEAERASRLKDEFLSTVSHELRTPLHAIVGWSHILRRRANGEQDFEKGLTAIDRNARAQVQLVEDLLDMSRIITGKLRLDVQAVDLHDVVNAAVVSIAPSADAKEISVQKILSPAAAVVRGDASRLEQVVWNLLNNAVKFTPEGGTVHVTLARTDSGIEIVVADNGPGISPAFLPYVFDRFRQGDGSTTRSHGGLGLGLAIVKNLVELHGGTVRAASVEGHGAIFTVELPLSIADIAREEDRAMDAIRDGDILSVADLSGVSVLIVDDAADTREVVARLLEERRADVRTAASAEEAMALMERQSPDVLVSDIGMPGTDGYEFIRAVRALPPERGGDVPAIALTAFARAEDRARTLSAGFHMHLAKPVQPHALLAAIGALARTSARDKSHT
jgi:PAS domain S-box-containing protein